MLEVVSMQQATDIVAEAFSSLKAPVESVRLLDAAGRQLAEDALAHEGMPPFDRSTVDGYAVCARDTFGCSAALPALLTLEGQVLMGEPAKGTCTPGTCIAIPTGGMVPAGADAIVMVEHTEDFGDGTIGVSKPVAPGENMVYRDDELKAGQCVIPAGVRLSPHHIAALASLGTEHVNVYGRPRVGIVSTGDEIVAFDRKPQLGQMRDANGPLLASALSLLGAEPYLLGISADTPDALNALIEDALQTCDMVLVSGGSSVGQRDNTYQIFSERGTVHFHGIAMKPGKPTLCATIDGKPAFGLPGHPLAAYFVFLEFVAPLVRRLAGQQEKQAPAISATLAEAVPSNHGRSECVPVTLSSPDKPDGTVQATPIRNKSGLISLLAQADGYFIIDRDQEGLQAGSAVSVKPFPGRE